MTDPSAIITQSSDHDDYITEKRAAAAASIPPVLVEYIEAIWPNRAPSIRDSDREVWASVGRQEVIAELKRLLDDQSNV